MSARSSFVRVARFALGACALGLGLAAVVASGAARAQAWPGKGPVKMVVPFAPGGATDILARTVAQKLQERIGQSVVVDNKPGAGTTIGNAAVAKSPPDGYTLLFAPTPFAISQALYRNLPYDAQKDFAPVALLATSPFILVAHPSVPAASLAELVALAKAKPGTLAFASAGNGTVPHLSGELFKTRAGIQLTHVPYKGGGPAMVDLVAGQTQLMFATPIEVMQYVTAGRLKVLATTAPKRLPSLPDVPTIAESGYPGFEVFSFFGVIAPAGTPSDVIARLGTELAQVVESAEVREKLAAQGTDVAFRPADGFRAFLASEVEKWTEAVRVSGAKVD